MSEKRSPNSTGANATGTIVWVTNTTGATWIAGRACRELISLSTPTAEAAAVARPQAAATARCPCERSSEASLVAMPLQPNARPAQTHGHRRRRAPERAQHVGQQARQREGERARCAIVERSAVWLVVRGGAHSPAPITPITIAADRDVLAASRVLAEHALAEEQQHEQAGGERGLHDDQRREQQRHHLQRPAEDRQAGAEHPAPALDQPPDERQAQVLFRGRLLGVHRLESDP